jgi:hypothetical protein
VKPCRGCGGPKGEAGPRAHFCDKCKDDPLARPLLRASKCRNGHALSAVGIIMVSGRWRCKACEDERSVRKWADPEKRARSAYKGRDNALKRKYGLSMDEYDRMLAAQDGHCALCPNTPKTRRLHVDHDHRTGKVRALLCMRCNRSLPNWVTPEWLRRAAIYLEDSA